MTRLGFGFLSSKKRLNHQGKMAFRGSWSIRTKIFLGIIIPALILMCVLYLDYVHLHALGRSADLILSENYRSIKACHQIRKLLEHQQYVILAGLLDHQRAEPLNLEAVKRQIAQNLQICQNNVTEPGERELITKLLATYQRYESLFVSLLPYQPEGKISAGPFAQLLNLYTTLTGDLDAVIVLNERAMEEAEKKTRSMARQAQQYSIVLLIAALCFTIISGYVLSSRISRPLVRLTESLATIKEGVGRYPQFPITTKDEIGSLTEEFNRLFERLQVYDQMTVDKLTAERLKVRQAEEAKARFVADLTHQLKTPMTSLSMSIGILVRKLGDTVTGKYGQLLETAEEDCKRLTALINELVDLARVDAMLKPWPKEMLQVEEMVNSCLRPLRPQAEEKGVELRLEFAADLPPITVDSFRFPWVITNLVGNAIRYTEPGGVVTIGAEKRGSRIYFHCTDTGRGIEEKYLPKIFDRFAQFSEREKMGAIGLGLAIGKDIIEQHGGDITVHSEVGRGTTFTFWLPIQSETENANSADY
jgi:signal transduction histidine kinase